MEYLWHTLLHRTDNFEGTTPRYLFEQQDVYMKVNGLSKEDKPKQKEQKELDRVEDFF